ncbi:disfunctional anti-sigma-K factor [Mycobacterium tuberculosis]|nr:disfunctional anti-sigma-K factor [Mycobacterium tuberculosis]
MTEHTDFELLELATPYALNAVSDDERADIDRRVAAAPSPVAAAFNDEVRAVRETMAVVSAGPTPPPSRQHICGRPSWMRPSPRLGANHAGVRQPLRPQRRSLWGWGRSAWGC